MAGKDEGHGSMVMGMTRLVTVRGHVFSSLVVVALFLTLSVALIWNALSDFADPPMVFAWLSPEMTRLIFIMGFISIPILSPAFVNHGLQACGVTAVVYGWETAEGPFLGTWLGRIGVRRRRFLLDGQVVVHLGREALRGNAISDKIRPRIIELRQGGRTLVFRSFAPLGLKQTQDALGDWFDHHHIKFTFDADAV